MPELITFWGGASGAAVITGTWGLIQFGLSRRAKKQDREREEKEAEVAKSMAEISELKKAVDKLIIADRMILYDRIKHLGKSYIDRGNVTVEEMEDLGNMHEVYHDLDGDGFLDNLMAKVNALDTKGR